MLPLENASLTRLSGPEWMAEGRQLGFELYEKLEMPSPKEEVWRYADLDFELGEFLLPEGPGPLLSDPSPMLEGLGELAGRATLVDGFVVEAEGDGATFTSLRTSEGRFQEALGEGIPPDLDLFAAAHQAFSHDGLLLHVPRNRTVGPPFFVDVQATTGGGVTFPRLVVILEENAEASVVLGYRSPAGERLLVVPRVEAVAGAGARLRLSAVQDWGYQTRAVAHQRVRAGRDAAVRVADAGLGARFGRLHLTVDLEGRGANAEVVGLYFGELDQLLDYRLFVHHRSPHTNSDVFLKGAVQDRSRSVFTGLIKIWKDAQKANAFETNRNLVLSEGARAESVPNLEILANDVRCGHGSTVGPIDEEMRYYLMTRGLSPARADRLIVRGFFEEILERLPQPGLAGPLRRELNEKFVAAQEEGRI